MILKWFLSLPAITDITLVFTLHMLIIIIIIIIISIIIIIIIIIILFFIFLIEKFIMPLSH